MSSWLGERNNKRKASSGEEDGREKKRARTDEAHSMKVETLDKKWRCPLLECNCVYTRKGDLKFHFKQKHQDSMEILYSSFPMLSRNRSTKSNKTYVCPILHARVDMVVSVTSKTTLYSATPIVLKTFLIYVHPKCLNVVFATLNSLVIKFFTDILSKFTTKYPVHRGNRIISKTVTRKKTTAVVDYTTAKTKSPMLRLKIRKWNSANVILHHLTNPFPRQINSVVKKHQKNMTQNPSPNRIKYHAKPKFNNMSEKMKTTLLALFT